MWTKALRKGSCCILARNGNSLVPTERQPQCLHGERCVYQVLQALDINIEAVADKHVFVFTVLVPSDGAIRSVEGYVEYSAIHMEG